MKKLLIFALGTLLLASCSSNNGELVGIYSRAWKDPKPYGMMLIPRGSFTMGPNDQDANWAMNSQTKTVSIDAFWMDETEITNGEYRQFVVYVRDSIVRERLADPAFGDDESFKITMDKKGNELETPVLNWNKSIPWKKYNEDQGRAIQSMYYSGYDATQLVPQLDATILNYKYIWVDYRQAALKENKFNAILGRYDRSTEGLGTTKDSVDVMIIKDTTYNLATGGLENKTVYRELARRGDFIQTKIVNVYPDTLCWIRDFTYAYNEPYMHMYFSHPGYGQYPVVGVTWEQAVAFCDWRTRTYNMALIRGGNPTVQEYRLPTEGEWEYAARGGRDFAMYPWGGQYIRDMKGCFLANFKPLRGNYGVDGFGITAPAGAVYPPNNYGLYNMAGNVAEWTGSAYDKSTPTFVHDMNPQYQYNAKSTDNIIRTRKVVKGGSWKDVGAFLQCGVKTYEYQTEARSYIGFRCVRSHIETGFR